MKNTTLCYIEKDGCYLLLHRVKKKADVNGGKWVGVGGHFEAGETADDCVMREVREETGLEIRSPQLCGIKDWTENGCRYVVLLYQATRFAGELVSSAEGEVRWEELGRLPSLKLSLDMQDMLRVFLEPELSEFFYEQDGDGAWHYTLK